MFICCSVTLIFQMAEVFDEVAVLYHGHSDDRFGFIKLELAPYHMHFS